MLLEYFSCVPRGTILGPKLFVLYVNDLASILPNCHIHFYTDDIKLVKQITNT